MDWIDDKGASPPPAPPTILNHLEPVQPLDAKTNNIKTAGFCFPRTTFWVT